MLRRRKSSRTARCPQVAGRVLAAVVAVGTGLSGCAEPEQPTLPVRVSGEIMVPYGMQASGPVTVNLYHAWALEGELRHPVEFIGSFSTEVGSYVHELDYPVDLGEGLLVYAWLDADGDGVLCTPDRRIDRAGLTEVEGFPAAEVAADVMLESPCAGPDWFYPPP